VDDVPPRSHLRCSPFPTGLAPDAEDEFHDPRDDLVGQEKEDRSQHAKIRTMMLEMRVSRRVGQVTFEVSVRTCWRNTNGLVVFDAMCRSSFLFGSIVCRPSGRGDADLFIESHARRAANRLDASHAIRARKAVFQPHAPRVCLPYIIPFRPARKWRIPNLVHAG
jgi:hypothetical protein